MAAIEREFLQLESTQGGWHALFQRLHQIARLNAGSQLQAKKPMNLVRNRYRDVLPIDETRVKLLDEDNDYINANFVKVEEVNRLYVLSQGPLQHTLTHFWQMIWEQKTEGIVMLNKCVERGMNKCYPYWPGLGENPMLLGNRYLVESVSCDEEDSYRLTHLRLHNLETEETRIILHFHYLRWPDFGVPQTPNVFLEFLLAVRGSGVLDHNVGPAVVHCSAGIGRSGTFCVVDVCLAMLEETKNLDSLNVQQLLLDMRKQRLGLIQTPDQLRFSYIAILQGAYGTLGMKNSLFELTKEMEQESESEEEELVPTDESEEEETGESQQQNKYPNLNRSYGVSYDNDAPPPIPPRPPDTLPPPPPPTSLPPGPPEVHPINDQGHPSSIQNEQDRESAKAIAAAENFENGEIYESASEEEEKREKGVKREEEPPPIPPRSNSLSPDTKSNVTAADVARDRAVLMHGIENGSADHFLGEGRGGGRSLSPLSDEKCGATAPSAGEDSEEIPPPIPEKMRGRAAPPKKPARDLKAEESDLLDELNRLISDQQREEGSGDEERVSVTTSQRETEMVSSNSSAELRRRQQRQDRNSRLTHRVQAMKDKLTDQEQQRGGEESKYFTSEWSVPWLILGFAVVVGYCVYYVMS